MVDKELEQQIEGQIIKQIVVNPYIVDPNDYAIREGVLMVHPEMREEAERLAITQQVRKFLTHGEAVGSQGPEWGPVGLPTGSDLTVSSLRHAAHVQEAAGKPSLHLTVAPDVAEYIEENVALHTLVEMGGYTVRVLPSLPERSWFLSKEPILPVQTWARQEPEEV